MIVNHVAVLTTINYCTRDNAQRIVFLFVFSGEHTVDQEINRFVCY